jgi:pyruvate dehydrogenase E2 component (dihydrolipoamide acetyltransferase)
LVDETIYLWKDINIGVATAIDSGLVVPVIHNAINKPVSQINNELKDLSNRAREGTLSLADVKNGTFTISNLGMFGIDQFRAIINPPESAILAIGKTVRKPVVLDKNDEIVVRPFMSITLSADHRVIDGVIAANFLQDLTSAIESPEILLY